MYVILARITVYNAKIQPIVYNALKLIRIYRIIAYVTITFFKMIQVFAKVFKNY
jgi:hypothetical protein